MPSPRSWAMSSQPNAPLQTTMTTTCTPYYILYIRITLNTLLKTDSTRTETRYANETKRMQKNFQCIFGSRQQYETTTSK